MILANKIILLRKKQGWSQEDLAGALDVTRQSVSKWESGISIPDLNKIIKLSEIFGVSTDYLLKDEIEEINYENTNDNKVAKISLKEVNTFVENKEKQRKKVSLGIMFCIFSFMPLFILLGMSENGNLNEDLAVALSFLFMALIAAVGVGIIISSNQYNDKLLSSKKGEFELEYGVEGIYIEKLEKYMPKYYRTIAFSVILFILLIPLVVVASLGGDEIILYFLAIVSIIVGIGVYPLVLANMKKYTYEEILKDGEYSLEKIEENKLIDVIGGIYWPIVVAIYLGWSFITFDWHFTWIIWPVAGLIFGAITGIVTIFNRNKEE